MLASVVLPSLLLFASSALSAAIFRRDNGCANFPYNGVSNNTGFSLWAKYNGSDTNLPLAMGTFSVGEDVEHVFLAPADYAGATVGNLFQLNNTGLVGLSSNGSKIWLSDSTDAGGPLPFAQSKDGSLSGISEDYCEVVSTDPNGSEFPGPLLAAEGTADGWSICNRTDNALYQGLVLNAANYSSDYGFNFSTCQSVHVYLESSAIGNQA